MSLVRPVKASTTTYRNTKLYSLKGSSGNSGLSAKVFVSDKQKPVYSTDSYSSDSYEKYFVDSPTEELAQPASSGFSEGSFNLHDLPSYQLRGGSASPMTDQNEFNPFIHQSKFDSDFLECSPALVESDGSNMRLKLQELERALLDDSDVIDVDEMMFGAGVCMDIDGEWSGPNRKEFLQDSPKESCSSDSNLSSISSCKETSHVSPRTPKQLLVNCASALSEGNIEQASTMIDKLRQMVSIQGEPSQRLAAYMVEGLAARMAASGKFIYKSLKCKEPPSFDRLAAMQVLFEVCPCFKFGFIAANGAIIEAIRDEKLVHIVDFDINQGNQYYSLIHTLASLPVKPQNLRLTGVDDPESVQRSVGGLEIIGLRLEKLAEELGVPFEFHAVPSKTSFITPSMLSTTPGEALIVNFAFQLHHMPDESVSTINERDQLLRFVKGLNPKLVTVVEQDVNTNTSPFFPRFIEAYNYYSAVFESLDVTLPRESQDRINVEKQCLARDIVNIVACEGEERIERYEVAGKWRARMSMAGFRPRPVSQNVIDTILKLIKQQYCDRYKAKEELGALHLGWEDKSLIVASVWM